MISILFTGAKGVAFTPMKCFIISFLLLLYAFYSILQDYFTSSHHLLIKILLSLCMRLSAQSYAPCRYSSTLLPHNAITNISFLMASILLLKSFNCSGCILSKSFNGNPILLKIILRSSNWRRRWTSNWSCCTSCCKWRHWLSHWRLSSHHRSCILSWNRS